MNTTDADPITLDNAAARFAEAAERVLPIPDFAGTGIVIAAGGPFVPSAYVVVRLLRRYGVTLPIEIWHAGPDEIPQWGAKAFEPWGVTLQDVMPFCPGRTEKQMRGWPIKPVAVMSTKFRHVLFLDADCFPLRNLEFLFASGEYKEHGALFWPDNKFYKMTAGGTIWPLTGLSYRGDPEFETGIFALDKVHRWRELCLTAWMNEHSSFWYEHVMGDKDTFYLGLRKFDAPHFVGPPCKRFSAVITRHFWKDGTPLVDHRTGTSKYDLPRPWGPFRMHLKPVGYRPSTKNIYDELMQRFIVRNFGVHTRFLDELSAVRRSFEGKIARASPSP